MSDRVITYRPAGPVIKAFHESSAFVRGIMGPFNSGKSSACVAELLRRAQTQVKSPDGKRHTRFAIIRNSYPELKTTTLNTWLQWCPREFGKVNMDSPFQHTVVTDEINMEVLFLALDQDADVRKLLSLELTGAWINEAREVPKSILDALTGRVGRWPSKVMGGCTHPFIILDTNPPDSESWWYKLAEEETPQGWAFFRQPSGLSPEAENLQNINGGRDYYLRQLPGKSEDFVKVYIHGDFGYVMEGKVVFPQYNDSFHCAKEVVEPARDLSLLIGADFGLTPAAVIAQLYSDGRLRIIDELTTDNTGIIRFAELLSSFVSTRYPNHDVLGCWADPAGNQRASTDERTALEIMNQNTKWKWKPAPGDNSLTERLEAVRLALNTNIDGTPRLQISPSCKVLRKAFTSAYHYKKIKSANGAMTSETPNKNHPFSDVMDALQYLILGSGGVDAVLNKKRSRGMRVGSYLKNRESDIHQNIYRSVRKSIFDD